MACFLGSLAYGAAIQAKSGTGKTAVTWAARQVK
jgi:hypothetical protein